MVPQNTLVSSRLLHLTLAFMEDPKLFGKQRVKLGKSPKQTRNQKPHPQSKSCYLTAAILRGTKEITQKINAVKSTYSSVAVPDSDSLKQASPN